MIGIGALQIILTALGLPGWRCPINAALSIPCPGCGISRALVLLLQGEWLAAIHMHAFSPVLIILFGLIIAIRLLPLKLNIRAVQAIAHIEKKTGCTTLTFIGMILYWAVR